MFEQRIQAYHLKDASVRVPQRRKKLQTFSSGKKTSSNIVNVAQQKLKKVLKKYAEKNCICI